MFVGISEFFFHNVIKCIAFILEIECDIYYLFRWMSTRPRFQVFIRWHCEPRADRIAGKSEFVVVAVWHGVIICPGTGDEDPVVGLYLLPTRHGEHGRRALVTLFCLTENWRNVVYVRSCKEPVSFY